MPEAARDLVLEPFFRIHDSRYMMYWRCASRTEYPALVASLAEKEKERLALDQRTLDQLALGEQQPEVDHGIEQEQSTTGSRDGKHYRQATGWFSYTLHNRGTGRRWLHLVHEADDPRTGFTLVVNGRELTRPQTTRLPDSNTTLSLFELPAEVLASEQLSVRFLPQTGLSTGKIFELRLLKEPLP
jgi:hypothetical protein